MHGACRRLRLGGGVGAGSLGGGSRGGLGALGHYIERRGASALMLSRACCNV